MTSTFFGLTPSYKLELHKTIFNMVTYGKGGWTWEQVYDLPIFLRMYYMKLLGDVLEREAGKQTSDAENKILRPPVVKETK